MRIVDNDGSPTTGRPEPTTYYTYEGRHRACDRVRSRGSRRDAGTRLRHRARHRQPGVPRSRRRGLDLLRDRCGGRTLRQGSRPLPLLLSACGPDLPIRLGDARLTLASGPTGQDLILLDAFLVRRHSDPPSYPAGDRPVPVAARPARGDRDACVEPASRSVAHPGPNGAGSRSRGLHASRHLPTSRWRPECVRPRTWSRSSGGPRTWAPSRPTRAGAGSSPDPARRPWTDDYSNVVEALVDNVRP